MTIIMVFIGLSGSLLGGLGRRPLHVMNDAIIPNRFGDMLKRRMVFGESLSHPNVGG